MQFDARLVASPAEYQILADSKPALQARDIRVDKTSAIALHIHASLLIKNKTVESRSVIKIWLPWVSAATSSVPVEAPKN